MRISDWSSDVCSSDLLVKLVELRLEVVPLLARVEGLEGGLDLAQRGTAVDPRQDGRRQARQRKLERQAVEIALQHQVALHRLGPLGAVQHAQAGYRLRAVGPGEAVGGCPLRSETRR